MRRLRVRVKFSVNFKIGFNGAADGRAALQGYRPFIFVTTATFMGSFTFNG